jgi:hypothetical protein
LYFFFGGGGSGGARIFLSCFGFLALDLKYWGNGGAVYFFGDGGALIFGGVLARSINIL